MIPEPRLNLCQHDFSSRLRDCVGFVIFDRLLGLFKSFLFLPSPA